MGSRADLRVVHQFEHENGFRDSNITKGIKVAKVPEEDAAMAGAPSRRTGVGDETGIVDGGTQTGGSGTSKKRGTEFWFGRVG
ncbi:hypothetical protein F0562_001991 [Nyssa sinensis]|uniref:Uncharacterized protein n=1 Tax=Nyssa sinensis TaxID=561372 RepID=A0A5J5C8K3_9ASTE|nr:hypothetical protein F0562_001991 [Nyssa sinensis]